MRLPNLDIIQWNFNFSNPIPILFSPAFFLGLIEKSWVFHLAKRFVIIYGSPYSKIVYLRSLFVFIDSLPVYRFIYIGLVVFAI